MSFKNINYNTPQMPFYGLGVTIFYFFIGVVLVCIFSKSNGIDWPDQKFNMILWGFISAILLHQMPPLILFPFGVLIVCIIGRITGIGVGRLMLCHGGIAFSCIPYVSSFIFIILIPSVVCVIIKQIHIIINL